MKHNFQKFPELTNQALAIHYFQSPHPQITEDINVKVEKVIDGDTIKVKWTRRDFEFRVRLSRIQAPELKKGGEESKQWLKQRLEGKLVKLEINKQNRIGKWGRLLAEVIEGGLNVNDESLNWGKSEVFGFSLGKIPNLEKEAKKWF